MRLSELDYEQSFPICRQYPYGMLYVTLLSAYDFDNFVKMLTVL